MFERRGDLIKFLAVAETGKILAAADRLAITQPALSRAIARLEEQFGGQLFERIPSGMRLTELGTMAAELAGRILHEMEVADAKIDDAVAGRTGRLRITASPVWMETVLPAAIADFRASCPGVELKLRTAHLAEGVRRLEGGESDLHCGGIDAGEPLPPFLKRESFLKAAWGIVAHRQHPLHRGEVALADLADCPWVDYEGATPVAIANGKARPSVSTVLDELRERTGKRVRTVIAAGAVGLFLLGTGPYLSWLPLPFLKALPDAPLQPLPVDLGQHRHPTGLIWRRSAEGISSFRTMRKIVRDLSTHRVG